MVRSQANRQESKDMTEVPLKCSCGIVQGVAHNITTNSGTRLVCYCDDCQAFARYLKRDNVILDEYGGTDIFQMTPSQIEITEGTEQLRCIRLSSKGLFRWYTACCKTPIGNTMPSSMPFVGLIHNFMDDEGIRDITLGPVRGYVQIKFAKEVLPIELKPTGFSLRMIMRSLRKLLIWKVKGLNKPSPFFDVDGNPISDPHILS